MQMFVGNASAQFHQFTYRIPEVDKTRFLTIPPMKQVRLADDLNQQQIDSIVEQHGPFGFASIEDVKRGAVKKQYTKLVYSVGTPIAAPIIEALFHSNHGILDAQGRQIRRETAVVANDAIQRQLQAEREKGLEADVAAIDITIQEEEQPSGGYDRPSSQVISEGFRVASEEAAAPVAPKGGRKRRG